MSLNPIQVQHINEVIRPAVESMVRALTKAELFVAEHEALQAGPDAIPETTDILDDAGDAPREDAPVITGEFVKHLYDTAVALRGQVTEEEKKILIQKMVRSLAAVLR